MKCQAQVADPHPKCTKTKMGFSQIFRYEKVLICGV